METTIRKATAADVPSILGFIRALAVFERAPGPGHGDRGGPVARRIRAPPVLLVPDCRAGRPAGRFRILLLQLLHVDGTPGHLSRRHFCLPEFRGLGIGKALLKEVAADSGGEAAGACSGRFWTGIPRRSISIAPWAPSFLTSGATFA